MEKKFKLPEFDYEVTIGKFANQADGAAWFEQNGTVILSTVVSAQSDEFPGFLPLTTDYREHWAAGGKIPGGYFKRETKSSDKEILVSRLIDRAIRPLFPEKYFNQVQALSTVYSLNKEHLPYTLSLISTSIALITSKIPFLGPIGAVEIAKIDDKWVINPSHQHIIKSDAKITVAGTYQGINMVEGRMDQITESEFIEALFMAHEVIKKQVLWQEEIAKEVGKEKEPILDLYNWQLWQEEADKFLTKDRLDNLFIRDKVKRSDAFTDLNKSFLEFFKKDTDENKVPVKLLDYIFNEALKNKLTQEIFEKNIRIDTRNFDQIRDISIEVGLLNFSHGSSLFKRGRTQAITSITLGGGQDEQKVEDIVNDTVEKTFMLHYNFPPFAVGEVKGLRAPGRREIGHGHLAASSLKHILPTSEKFPYTIRIVTDILESDGSSSMATVCGSTMALMNAGVPIGSMVSGIAMGLIANEKGEFKVLSDIAGVEDAFGLMDFKVAGTDKGITAVQMDIKYKGGLDKAVFEKALNQAKSGRAYILDQMKKVMSAPNPNLSQLVPHIYSFKIPKDKIGAVIGPSGKYIKEVIEKTDTTIDIEEDGLVKIFGHKGPKLDQAISWIKTLAGVIEPGSKYTGKVKKITDFGIFIEIVPGLDGLLHISNMPKELKSDYKNKIKVNDTLDVEVLDFDSSTGRIRLKKI